jgi:hypothetical protein
MARIAPSRQRHLRQYRLLPTKALVSAYAARIARRAAEYGVVIGGDIAVDLRRVKARMDAIVAAVSSSRRAEEWRAERAPRPGAAQPMANNPSSRIGRC